MTTTLSYKSLAVFLAATAYSSLAYSANLTGIPQDTNANDIHSDAIIEDGVMVRSPTFIRFPLTATTVNPPWPPSESMDKDGNFVAIGRLLEVEDGNGNCFPGPPRAAIVSKDTVPPLDANGKENFSNPFGACYDVIRDLDLSEGSPDRDLVLYTSSFGPSTGDFGGGPRIPAEGDSLYNLNFFPTTCPEIFPTSEQELSYKRPAYPLHDYPITGFFGDQVQHDVTTDEVIEAEREVHLYDRTYSKPITVGRWLDSDQKSNLTVHLRDYDPEQGAFTAAEFDFDFKHLIPDSVYSLWGLRQITWAVLSSPPIPPLNERVPPTPLFLPNTFSTDAQGNAHFIRKMENPFPAIDSETGHQRVLSLSVALHPDAQSWGACFSRLGVAVDHAVHLVSRPRDVFSALKTVAKKPQ